MTSPDWVAGIIWIGVMIGCYILAVYVFNPEKEQRRRK